MDDGAANFDEAGSMMRIAAESGTKSIVATPHVIEGKWLPSWQDIVTKCRQLQTVAKAMNLDLAIYPGAEVCVNWDILTRISGPGPYCINGSRYMLVELPAVEVPGFTDDFLFALQTRGITPVLAHPERHPAIIKEPRILAEWINRGMLAQVNGSSLTGRFGEKVMRMAEYLLTNKMVHCLGSDGHGDRIRKPGLAKPAEKIRKLFNEEHIEQWLVHNPKQIISDREMEIDEISVMKPLRSATGIRGRLSRLFG
jgi:protein-tyrosine phosphatase